MVYSCEKGGADEARKRNSPRGITDGQLRVVKSVQLGWGGGGFIFVSGLLPPPPPLADSREYPQRRMPVIR